MVKKISIIIPCRGHLDVIKFCLRGIYENNYERSKYEIIVVNSGINNNIDDLRLDFPSITIINSNTAMFAGTARNIGAKSANGNILCFIDADCIPAKNWLKSIEDAFENDIVMAGGVIETSNPNNILASGDNFIHFYMFSKFRPAQVANGLAGANMNIKKDVFIEMNGFADVRFPEDWELSQRIYQRWPAGSIFDPNIKIFHRGRETFKSYYDHQFIHGFFRGKDKLEITGWQQNFGRFYIFLPLVILKRLNNIYSTTFKYNMIDGFQKLLLLPSVLYGLFCWALGFRKGCKETYDKK
ncbi:MAG: glycosyltransferase [Chloroflexi bacterium]|jgi:cellulose synthase/poly-beta-1,6-N-acetylglucosamine synthase-like glycosyltransferase|nr:glycosyltransferase [Chloroflexota bacterium]MBT3669521.1 glycosyltransferase [Chloroflexota bacterium]MBT4304460.1 glycosyltransferase [Chloroflexota bacterium]MBT4534199.1 glycosyltransferase [Chloroflexota bacterium]MBT4683418.1 glycosyltransferase [Chloroflexota bacterium]